MADDLLNRLTRLERLLRAGFTTAKLVITGLATLGSLSVSGSATVATGVNVGAATGAATGEIKASAGAQFDTDGAIGDTAYVTIVGGRARFGYDNGSVVLDDGGTTKQIIFRTGSTPTTRVTISSGGVVTLTNALLIPDGITAPGATAGSATIYVDTADGDLKVKFGDGTVKTIVTDT